MIWNPHECRVRTHLYGYPDECVFTWDPRGTMARRFLSRVVTVERVLPIQTCMDTVVKPPRGGGARNIHDGGGGVGGPTDLHIANPKKYTSLKI